MGTTRETDISASTHWSTVGESLSWRTRFSTSTSTHWHVGTFQNWPNFWIRLLCSVWWVRWRSWMTNCCWWIFIYWRAVCIMHCGICHDQKQHWLPQEQLPMLSTFLQLSNQRLAFQTPMMKAIYCPDRYTIRIVACRGAWLQNSLLVFLWSLWAMQCFRRSQSTVQTEVHAALQDHDQWRSWCPIHRQL